MQNMIFSDQVQTANGCKRMQPNAHRLKTVGAVSQTKVLNVNWDYKQK